MEIAKEIPNEISSMYIINWEVFCLSVFNERPDGLM